MIFWIKRPHGYIKLQKCICRIYEKVILFEYPSCTIHSYSYYTLYTQVLYKLNTICAFLSNVKKINTIMNKYPVEHTSEQIYLLGYRIYTGLHNW